VAERPVSDRAQRGEAGMTEVEWLACQEPQDMLIFIKQHRGMRSQKKQRNQRLFSVACCRRIWPLIVNDRSRRCVEVFERFADGQATDEERQAAEAESRATWLTDAADDTLLACLHLFGKSNDGLRVSTTTISAVFTQQQREAGRTADVMGGRRRGACPSEEREQCTLLRCIFGNPFRTFTMHSAWQTSTVRSLAQATYEERLLPSGHLDPARLAVLTDALEDAGCDDAEILGHLRSPGPHVRGCWPVDLLLGKK
jgi:hypothetical protein